MGGDARLTGGSQVRSPVMVLKKKKSPAELSIARHSGGRSCAGLGA